MKAHNGVDSKTKLIHTVSVTPANVHDSQVLEYLLHGDETRVWSDSAYAGQKETLNEHALHAKDFTQKNASRYRQYTEAERSANRHKSKTGTREERFTSVQPRY